MLCAVFGTGVSGYRVLGAACETDGFRFRFGCRCGVQYAEQLQAKGEYEMALERYQKAMQDSVMTGGKTVKCAPIHSQPHDRCGDDDDDGDEEEEDEGQSCG